MKIAFICKRRYTGKDVVSDRFGRLYEIPRQLAQMGHAVRGFCLDYYHSDADCREHPVAAGTLWWESRSIRTWQWPTMLGYPWQLLQRLREFAPDVLVGASDIPHVILTAWLARQLRIPYAVDLYDNFESFSVARVPGIVIAYRRAIKSASYLTVVSAPLKRMVEEEYAVSCPVSVMTNAVDKVTFRHLDKTRARQSLGLPVDAVLVGTAGGLHRSKGVGTLYSAWAQLAAERADIHLVLAGPVERGLPLPQGERVHYLGQLSQERVAELFNALDAGVVTLLDSAFGRFCFPQKLYEMVACGLPVVAASVGAIPSLLKSAPHLLYPAEDATALAAALRCQLADPGMPDLVVPDWEQLVAGVEPEYRKLAQPASNAL